MGLGGITVGGLAAMTLGGELMHPLKQMGLGHISAMIGDVVNYRMISGVIIGAILTSGLRTPLNYYVNSLLRPWLLDVRSFTELMGRDAFESPELLRTPSLIEAMKALAPEGGKKFSTDMIGYYGFPDEYYGFFRELSYARLGYFALAGIARTGFFDEAWFVEALSRTGYSPTAKDRLLDMMRELVTGTKLMPVLGTLRSLTREGFITQEEVGERIAQVLAIPNLTEIRLFAFTLESEYDSKVTERDIILRAYSRGIITEGEAYEGLGNLGIAGEKLQLEVLREKLGLVRRVYLEVPQVPAGIEVVEGE